MLQKMLMAIQIESWPLATRLYIAMCLEDREHGAELTAQSFVLKDSMGEESFEV